MNNLPRPTHGKEAPSSAQTPLRRRRRWGRVLLLIVVLAVVFHGPLLRNAGRLLTVKEPVGPWDAVLVLGGEHRIEVVKQLFDADQIDRVWMIDGRPTYLVTAGIMPSTVDVATAELIDAGASSERLIAIEAAEAVDVADFARVVKGRLQQEPETRLLVLCNALNGRHVRLVFDDVLGETLASAVSIRGLPYDEYDVDEWWRSRSGLKQVFGQACAVGFTLVMGTEPRKPPVEVDPDALETALRERFGGAACYAD